MIRILVFIVGIVLCGYSSAIPIERRIYQLKHDSWKTKDGAPASITTIAQTDDGYLWLGTSEGLYRFDGVSFELHQPRDGKLLSSLVYVVKAQPGVGLWIGWGLGGISLMRDGVVTHYGKEAGVSEGSWWGFDFDQQGNVWAAGVDGLLRFDGKRWHRIGIKDGFTARKASAVFVDKAGTVAAFSDQGLFLKAANSQVFAPPLGKTDVRQPPQQDSEGRIYFMEESSIRLINGLARYEQPDNAPIFKGKPGQSQSMLVDRSGSLWYETLAGLHRTSASAPRSVESFNSKDGLTADTISCFFEDREGNIWVATSDGLDRFRQVDVNRVVASNKTYSLGKGGLLAGSENLMTVALPGTDGAWLALTPDGTIQNRAWLARHPRGRTQATAIGNDGAILVADGRALYKFKDGAEKKIPWPADMGPVGLVHAITQGRDGVIWISIVGGGMLQYQQGQWSRNTALPKNGTQAAMSMLSDSRGRLWLGYADNKIALLENGEVRIFPGEQGGNLGRVAVLYEADGNVIAGGEKGLAIYRNQQFHPWEIDGNKFANASSMTLSKAGDLWVNSAAGTVWIPSSLQKIANGRKLTSSQVRVLDSTDGRTGSANLLHDFSVAEAGDGKIWIANDSGVSWVDPSRLLIVPTPPPAVVDALIADDQNFRFPLDVKLRPNSHAIQINYSSALLGTPERMRFKYRLDGYDKDWQDAGSRRQAFYTGLPPGRYRFRVIASNSGGPWSAEGRDVYVTLEPTYYQTWWFRTLIAALVVSLIWLGLLLRMRRNAKMLRVQMDARLGERERIAREMHDTLLQGMQALILGVDNTARRLPVDDPARESFDRLLDKAEAILAEGRDQVFDLRGSDCVDIGAFALIEKHGTMLASEANLKLICHESGKKRDLVPGASHEIYRIAIEAMTNAVRHAQARTLVVSVRYRYFSLQLEIRDDGIGISPEVLATKGIPGHFGIPGLFERAAKLHADLQIDSRNSAGTSVKLRVPAQVAYLPKSFIPFK
jgi:signal transduction histidine kinase/ligand-binding sensor domain-containing protein